MCEVMNEEVCSAGCTFCFGAQLNVVVGDSSDYSEYTATYTNRKKL